MTKYSTGERILEAIYRPVTYQDVRYPDGSLAFRIDAERMIVEIQRRGQKHYFDLATMLVEGVDKNNLLR